VKLIEEDRNKKVGITLRTDLYEFIKVCILKVSRICGLYHPQEVFFFGNMVNKTHSSVINVQKQKQLKLFNIYSWGDRGRWEDNINRNRKQTV
jgi:hypothetical protein